MRSLAGWLAGLLLAGSVSRVIPRTVRAKDTQSCHTHRPGAIANYNYIISQRSLPNAVTTHWFNYHPPPGSLFSAANVSGTPCPSKLLCTKVWPALFGTGNNLYFRLYNNTDAAAGIATQTASRALAAVPPQTTFELGAGFGARPAIPGRAHFEGCRYIPVHRRAGLRTDVLAAHRRRARERRERAAQVR